VPAVQNTREAARLTQCKNNLKQLAAAVHTFEESHTKLPPSDLGDGWATWAVLLLPQLEQSSVYARWDLTRSYYSQLALCGLDLQVYHCPSRIVANRMKGDVRPFTRDGLRTGPIGWSDYGGVVGTDVDLANGAFVRALNRKSGVTVAIPLTSPATQVIDPRYPLGFGDFTDGQSSTLLFGEKHFFAGDNDPSVFNGDFNRGFSRACGPSLLLVADPNYSALDGRNRFGSLHPGICHFALADGSVRAIKVTIDGIALGRLATRASGEVVSGDDY